MAVSISQGRFSGGWGSSAPLAANTQMSWGLKGDCRNPQHHPRQTLLACYDHLHSRSQLCTFSAFQLTPALPCLELILERHLPGLSELHGTLLFRKPLALLGAHAHILIVAFECLQITTQACNCSLIKPRTFLRQGL